MKILPIDDENSDLSLVYIGHLNHPHCKLHGAMNRVSKDTKMYRCLRAEPDKLKYTKEQRKAMDCRAGCKVEGEF